MISKKFCIIENVDNYANVKETMRISCCKEKNFKEEKNYKR